MIIRIKRVCRAYDLFIFLLQTGRFFWGYADTRQVGNERDTDPYHSFIPSTAKEKM